MSGKEEFIGIVEFGMFRPLDRPGGSFKLTGIPIQAAQSPESREIRLNKDEGCVLMVHGQASGGWLYSAEVTEKAGPILSAVVKKIFS